MPISALCCNNTGIQQDQLLYPAHHAKRSSTHKISETPSLPEFTVGGGEGNSDEEAYKWLCTNPNRFSFAWRGAE
jgi:hypothetical protein